MCQVNELSNAFIILVSRELGDNWQIGEDVSEELESFTCVLYGQGRDTSVNALRCKMLKKMIGEEATLNIKSKVDLARLPPCKDSLIPHIQRVNYRVACYKRAAQPNFSRPKPHDVAHGWQQNQMAYSSRYGQPTQYCHFHWLTWYHHVMPTKRMTMMEMVMK